MFKCVFNLLIMIGFRNILSLLAKRMRTLYCNIFLYILKIKLCINLIRSYCRRYVSMRSRWKYGHGSIGKEEKYTGSWPHRREINVKIFIWFLCVFLKSFFLTFLGYFLTTLSVWSHTTRHNSTHFYFAFFLTRFRSNAHVWRTLFEC